VNKEIPKGFWSSFVRAFTVFFFKIRDIEKKKKQESTNKEKYKIESSFNGDLQLIRSLFFPTNYLKHFGLAETNKQTNALTN